MILNQQNVNEATRGFRAIFSEALDKAESVARKIAMVVQSSNSQETWEWIESTAQMRELVGEIEIANAVANSFSIPNKEFVGTVQVPQAAVERDSLGIFKPFFQELGDLAYAHDDQSIAALLTSGFTKTCYDGSAFFSTTHKYRGAKTAWSNKLTAKLSAASFETARAMIKAIKKADGTTYGNGKKLALIVSAKNESTARTILNAEQINGTSNVNKGTAEVMVWPELDALNEDAWFILELGKAFKPVVIQEERKPDLVAVDNLEDSYVVKNHHFLYQSYKRTGYGYALPQLAVGSDGSAS